MLDVLTVTFGLAVVVFLPTYFHDCCKRKSKLRAETKTTYQEKKDTEMLDESEEVDKNDGWDSNPEDSWDAETD